MVAEATHETRLVFIASGAKFYCAFNAIAWHCIATRLLGGLFTEHVSPLYLIVFTSRPNASHAHVQIAVACESNLLTNDSDAFLLV